MWVWVFRGIAAAGQLALGSWMQRNFGTETKTQGERVFLNIVFYAVAGFIAFSAVKKLIGNKKIW